MWPGINKLWNRVFSRKRDMIAFPQIFEQFQTLLEYHQKAMELITDLGEKSGGEYIFDRKYLFDSVHQLQDLLLRMIKALNLISSNRYYDLYPTLDRIFLPLEAELRGRLSLAQEPYVIKLADARLDNQELIGGKAGALAQIIHRLRIPVPDGFVITNRAYHRFLEYNELADRIHAWIEAWVTGKEDLRKAAGQIRYSLLAGIVPQDVAREIKQHARGSAAFWAVRSSAYGEDGELSFAGLHESVLNVPSEQIIEAYKKVLASLYSPEALVYRSKTGMIGEEGAMSVLCNEMVASKASGVVQSVHLRDGAPDSLAVYAAFGLGRTVVEGRAQVDRFIVERKSPNQIRSKDVARKESLIIALPGGGEREDRVTDENQLQPAISDETVRTLVKWALALERYFKRPQEMEWAVDDAGRCWLLQSRRLIVPEIAGESREDICESCSLYPVLIEGHGSVAHAGVGSGIVHIVNSNDDMDNFQDGAVLVTRFTAPWLAQVAPMASAIIAERGSVAGHLATIAREFRVPTLVGVEDATKVLRNGMEVTLDTHNGIVYAGRVRELIRYELVQSMVFEESPEFRMLRRILKRVAPLHLIDPQSPDFTAAGCVSAHDVIRFIHEKAVMELIDLPTFLKRFKGAKVWTLASSIPIDLKILDIGGGIDPDATGSKIAIEEIQCLPLRALWAGVSLPDTWDTEPINVDFKGLMSSFGKNWDADPGGLGVTGVNLAVINRIYMNLHLHLGYHFNLIDARMDDEPQHNHIYFRFVGGVTDVTRRSRRAQLLARILSHYHFNVAVKGDLVIGRLLHLPKEEIHRRLGLLGILIGFTRQLDIQLRTDRDTSQFVEMFFDRHAKFIEGSLAERPGGKHEWRQAENYGVG